MAKVYIKTNEKDEITEIGSSIFIPDPTGYTEIDEGSGDRYVHAQGNYLPNSIIDEEGSFRYVYKDGRIWEKTEQGLQCVIQDKA